jgi:hypothetical protein
MGGPGHGDPRRLNSEGETASSSRGVHFSARDFEGDSASDAECFFGPRAFAWPQAIPPHNPSPPRNEMVSGIQIRQTRRFGIRAWRLIALKAEKEANCCRTLSLQSLEARAKPAKTRLFSLSREKSRLGVMCGWHMRIRTLR